MKIKPLDPFWGLLAQKTNHFLKPQNKMFHPAFSHYGAVILCEKSVKFTVLIRQKS